MNPLLTKPTYTNLANKLNNIFATQERIDIIKQALLKNPTKYKLYEVRNNTIFYKPLNLEVLDKNNIQPTLQDEYDNNNNAIGKGINQFYKLLSNKYIGITRDICEEFLKQQPDYQLLKPANHRVNKPIISKYPNGLWSIDLIDMSKYVGYNTSYNWIFTCVDVFSRKVWLEKMTTKTAIKTRDAFKRIIERAGISPNNVLSDNGGEFKGEFSQFCDDEDIKQRFTRAYTPEANGITERMNREVRKIIRAYMVRNNTLKWTDILQDVENNKNATFNEVIKATPNDVWSQDKTKTQIRELPLTLDGDNPKLHAKINIVKRALKQVRKFQDTDNLRVGDFVRVKMSSLFSNMRKEVKAGNNKTLLVNWSPIIFQVNAIIKPSGVLERKRYIVMNTQSNNRVQYDTSNLPSQFYASDLQKVDENDVTDMTMDRALQLNKIQRNNSDLLFV